MPRETGTRTMESALPLGACARRAVRVSDDVIDDLQVNRYAVQAYARPRTLAMVIGAILAIVLRNQHPATGSGRHNTGSAGRGDLRSAAAPLPGEPPTPASCAGG